MLRSIIRLTSTVSLLAVTGCSEHVVTGTLVDGLSGKAIPEMRLIAQAASATSTSCSVGQTFTDKSGAFTFEGLCNDVAYTIKTENENIWLADGNDLPAGTTDLGTMKGYLAPDGVGVYRVLDGELARIKTNADIQTEPIWNNDTETVSYPAVIPTEPVAIPPEGKLLLTGKDNVEKMTFTPLIASGDRMFGSSKTTVVKMKPWSYIGTAFTSDTAFERKTATLDQSKVMTKSVGDRHASWIAGDALPAGRYVVHQEGATRTTVLEFGKAAEKK
jgi:hypothetical protein